LEGAARRRIVKGITRTSKNNYLYKEFSTPRQPSLLTTDAGLLSHARGKDVARETLDSKRVKIIIILSDGPFIAMNRASWPAREKCCREFERS